MRILLVAATRFEIEGTLKFLASAPPAGVEIEVLITGPGIVATTRALTRLLCTGLKPVDLAINAGIAGSFDPDLLKGTVVQVSTDVFADFGAEDGEEFIPATLMGLSDPEKFPSRNGILIGSHSLDNLLPYACVKGITVNTVSGNDDTIRRRRALFGGQTESMEGAAFFYCCLTEGIDCLQLRSVSNPVEKRNKANWNLPLAVNNLNNALIELINRLNG